MCNSQWNFKKLSSTLKSVLWVIISSEYIVWEYPMPYHVARQLSIILEIICCHILPFNHECFPERLGKIPHWNKMVLFFPRWWAILPLLTHRIIPVGQQNLISHFEWCLLIWLLIHNNKFEPSMQKKLWLLKPWCSLNRTVISLISV